MTLTWWLRRSIPFRQRVADAFLLAHVHPRAVDGKTLMQLVEPDLGVRIDIFGECAATLRRSRASLVSLEDLAARAARAVLDLEEGVEVESKHADAFLRMEHAVDSTGVETAWREHRKHGRPRTFQEAAQLIHELMATREHLLVSAEYSQDVDAVCEKCENTAPFRCAPATTIRTILGYC